MPRLATFFMVGRTEHHLPFDGRRNDVGCAHRRSERLRHRQDRTGGFAGSKDFRLARLVCGGLLDGETRAVAACIISEFPITPTNATASAVTFTNGSGTPNFMGSQGWYDIGLGVDANGVVMPPA